MATPAQLNANRTNAQTSTGPRTDEGKLRTSRNAVSSGLFSRGDFVRPDETGDYAEFCAAYITDLSPNGAIEQTLAAEIIHAAWRLRRCSVIEAAQSDAVEPCAEDPMIDDKKLLTQDSLDRARNHATRLLHRNMAELRRLQTERHFRAETRPAELDREETGLVSFKDLSPTLIAARRADFAKQTQIASQTACQTARNAPCTCGSGNNTNAAADAPPLLWRGPRDSLARLTDTARRVSALTTKNSSPGILKIGNEKLP